MLLSRRHLLTMFGLSTIATLQPKAIASYLPIHNNISLSEISEPSLIKPPRLKIGDTIGLINPAGFSYPQEIAPILPILSQLGFRVKLGEHIFDRYGYLGGTDHDRASDVNLMFADPSVNAILAVQGGWGCNRILPLIDYTLIRNHPKIIMGFSDITSLLIAIYTKTKIVTFHGPVGISNWTEFTINSFQQVVLKNDKNPTLANPSHIKVETITPGKVKGELIGGNLSVLTAMIGSVYLPFWQNKILFVEEVGEDIYRVDRMLTQLRLAGILEQISGFIFGQCTNCKPEKPQESLTLSQVLTDHIQPLKIPAWYGSAIGHISDIFTLPLGIEVEINAHNGTIKLLESAVIEKN
jgi:muramoyltetrapeptide carboxypeptidase